MLCSEELLRSHADQAGQARLQARALRQEEVEPVLVRSDGRHTTAYYSVPCPSSL